MNRKHISLEMKFLAFFILLAVALFVTVGFLFLKSTQPVINASKETQLLTLSQETANKIERFLFERYGDIQVMAQSPILKSQDTNLNMKIEYLETVRKAYKTYDYILIADQEGNTKIVSGNGYQDDKYREWLQTAKKSKIYISDFIYNEEEKSYKVYFAAPIIDDAGNISSIVVERMNFKSIAEIINNVKPGEKAVAYLLDSEPIGKLAGKAQGILYSSKENQGDIYAYSKIKGYETWSKNWYLVISEPKSEAFQVSDSLRRYTILVILISISISFILATIMSRIITMPIKKLVKETQNIAAGDINRILDIKSSDEIGSLAQSFNMILTNLKFMMQQVLEISGEAASLAEIRQYTEKFFNEIPTGIITIDSKGKITAFNSTAVDLSGIIEQQIIDKNIYEIEKNSFTPIFKLMIDGLDKEAIYIKQLMHIDNNALGELPIMVNTSLQKDNNGNVLGVVAVIRSVKEIKEFEESIIRANNLASLGALSAGMAHEIRNPLTSVKGYAQYIKSELGENHQLLPDINIIINEVDRLNNIIDRFLTFARPRRPELVKEDANEIITNVIKLLDKDIKNANITVDVKLQKLPEIPIDMEQIEQVAINMIVNSIQAMQSGGNLEIATRYEEKQEYIEILIKDTGEGINSKDIENIFEPFFTTKNKGTGLGLAICLRIIENHKGFIEVSSTPGVGTSFVIKLPV